MKISRLSIAAVMLIMIVVITAGCSSKPKVGSTVSSSSVLSTNYKWITYQETSNDPILGGTITSNVRVEKSTDSYQGTPAILIKTTSGSTATNGIDSGSFVSEIYFDTLMKTVLGGTKTTTYADGRTTTAPVTGSKYSDMSIGIDLNNAMLTYEGPESVTVPLGTYSNADMYTVPLDGASASLWMVSGIPVPVKVTASTQNLKVTRNLVSWG